MTAGKDHMRGTSTVRLHEQDLEGVEGGTAVNPPAQKKVNVPGDSGLLREFGQCACEAAVQDSSRG